MHAYWEDQDRGATIEDEYRCWLADQDRSSEEEYQAHAIIKRHRHEIVVAERNVQEALTDERIRRQNL